MYAVFGVFKPQTESEKLDVATGGEDMPKLEDEDEAEKRQKIRTSPREKSSSESEKEKE